ncbi:hypothetical protein Tco_0578299 [Tanacetum coccineum]
MVVLVLPSNWFPLTKLKWLPLIANSFAVLGIVIAEPRVGATTWSGTHIGVVVDYFFDRMELFCFVDEVFDSEYVQVQVMVQQDSLIPIGQRNTLVGYMILSGADNRPAMLDKDMYDSWKSRIELYMQNRENGRMILESVEHGPLIWPTIEENGRSGTKKIFDIVSTDKIQADCDMKVINIILQGLPDDIYSLVNHYRVAKDLWEKVQLLNAKYLMTKQERM